MEIKVKQSCYCNEIGRRENNEDSIYPEANMADANSRLFIVCDGVGGCERGEVASKSVAQSFAEYWLNNSQDKDTEEKVNNALNYSLEELQKLQNEEDKGKMGTTLTLTSISRDSILVAHIGDSRIYHIRPNEGVVFRTKDHSQVQIWIDAGLLSVEQAKTHPKRNVITRAIQPYPEEIIFADVAILTDVQDGDYIFMCSDGVLESVDDNVLCDIINESVLEQDAMDKIVVLCRENSKDNFSAYLISLSVETQDDELEAIETFENSDSDSIGSLTEQEIMIRAKQRSRNKIDLKSVSTEFIDEEDPVIEEDDENEDAGTRSWVSNIFSTVKEYCHKKRT